MCDELGLALVVGDDAGGGDPNDAGFIHFEHGSGVVFIVGEIIEVDTDGGVESACGGEVGGCGRSAKISEWVVGKIGIAPEPVDFILEGNGEVGVLSHYTCVEVGVAGGWFLAEFGGVTVDALAGDLVETTRDLLAFDFDGDFLAGRGGEAFSTNAEAIGGEFVAIGFDFKMYGLIHEAGFVEGDESGGVGDVNAFVGGGEFDEWYAAVGLLVEDLDGEGLGVGDSRQGERSEDGG